MRPSASILAEPATRAEQREPLRAVASELPRALWDAPGELPQQYAADRTFVAPMPPVRNFGKPGDNIVMLPDTHAPYHSRKGVRFAERCIRAVQPKVLVILGDWVDFYSVSFHDRSPGRVSRLADEVEVAAELLRVLEAAAPDATRIFIEGNHENRLARYVAKNAGALHGMPGTTLDEMLHLSDNGWNLIPYHDMCMIGSLAGTHEAGHAGVNAARATMLGLMSSTAMGHAHRAQSIIQRGHDGRSLVTHLFGWLGEWSTIDYRHRRRAMLEWPHGIGYGAIDDSSHTHMQQVDLNGDSTFIGGEIVRAR